MIIATNSPIRGMIVTKSSIVFLEKKFQLISALQAALNSACSAFKAHICFLQSSHPIRIGLFPICVMPTRQGSAQNHTWPGCESDAYIVLLITWNENSDGYFFGERIYYHTLY